MSNETHTTADTNVTSSDTGADGKALHSVLFANFDAGRPCLVSIPGHAVVADGYGYEPPTEYGRILARPVRKL